MTVLRKRMIQDMILAGLAARTQENYVCAVAQLAKHHKSSPDLLTEEQVKRYLVDLIEIKHAARGTFLSKSAALRFFYVQTLGLDWDLFSKKNFGPRLRNVCRGPSPMTIS